MSNIYGTQAQMYVHPASIFGWNVVIDDTPRPTTNLLPNLETIVDTTPALLSGASESVSLQSLSNQSIRLILGLASGGYPPLTEFEIEDALVSKIERKRGESKHFSKVEDLFADLDS